MKLSTLKPKIATIDTRRGAKIAVERITGGKLVKIRERIGLRDLYICQKCGRTAFDGEVDHRCPLHRGGSESDENRQWLCPKCHTEKNAEEEKERRS
jgi:5-methylcytosine-specific restriction endonuclease McrA